MHLAVTVSYKYYQREVDDGKIHMPILYKGVTNINAKIDKVYLGGRCNAFKTSNNEIYKWGWLMGGLE
jgi:alpha-tubulin suppressor-like RCC1 family protein